MNWLRQLPGFQRSPPGLEWAVWKRLPSLLLLSTALPGLLALAYWWAASDGPSIAEQGDLLLAAYRLVGLVLLLWTLLLTLAIGCAIVMIMKGPAYVADPYPPPERDE